MLKRLALALAGAFLCASGALAAEQSTVTASLTALNPLEVKALDLTQEGRWFIQNQSAASLTVVLCASIGVTTPCARPSATFVLGPGSGGAGTQGGSIGWQDTGEWRGRIDIYGAAGSQHSFMSR